jgi:hypothetical protein
MKINPIRVLSFGAGVQSTTLLRMMIHNEVERAEHVIFADTGWEPLAVYDHLKAMQIECENADMQFHVVSGGNIRDDSLNADHRFASMPLHVLGKNGKPAIARRQCTNEYKLKPLLNKQREIAGLKSGQRNKQHLITTIIGISWDESQRMRDAAFSWIKNEYPLVNMKMTRRDCLAWNEKNGYALPPRSACLGCPYHSNNEWRNIKDNDPLGWADVIDFDERIRSDEAISQRLFEGRAYLHPKRIPLVEVDLRTEEDRGQLNMFEMECEGMCGL